MLEEDYIANTSTGQLIEALGLDSPVITDHANDHRPRRDYDPTDPSGDVTLNETIALCPCRRRPVTRYRAGKVWIECVACARYSVPANNFPDTELSWNYLISRNLHNNKSVV